MKRTSSVSFNHTGCRQKELIGNSVACDTVGRKLFAVETRGSRATVQNPVYASHICSHASFRRTYRLSRLAGAFQRVDVQCTSYRYWQPCIRIPGAQPDWYGGSPIVACG